MKKEIIYSVILVIVILVLYLLAVNAASLLMHNICLILALVILIADMVHIIKKIKNYRNER
jgi:hypothetical protein